MTSTSGLDFPSLSNTSLDGNPYVVVTLPEAFDKFDGRILDFDNISLLTSYYHEVTSTEGTFDIDEFIGVKFYRLPRNKCTVMALHESLKYGPEFHINRDKDEITMKLRSAIVDYLDKHKDLGYTIDMFM